MGQVTHRAPSAGTLDNKNPVTSKLPHLKRNFKREQVELERVTPLLKMQILSELGIPREDMFLTLARDTIRRADHAVLVVRLDGQPLVLDNGSDALLDGSVANDFRPVYSFSGNRRFLHGF